jgi:hypothetical protein
MSSDERLAKIAKDYLRVPTLDTRNSDSLDFHTISVWGLKQALKLAYLMGKYDGQKQ